MRVLYSKLFYIIILLVLGIVLFLLLKNKNTNQDFTTYYYVSGNMSNLGCLSIHIDDLSEDNEYSFDGGKSWQKSKYGAIYQSGENVIQIRNEKQEIIIEKEIGQLFFFSKYSLTTDLVSSLLQSSIKMHSILPR